LHEKGNAMKNLDEPSRAHEEFRLRIEKERTVALESVHMRRDVAEAQAKVLAEAMSQAKINIVGGDGAFFDRFVRAVGMGQALDGAVEQSDTAKTLLREYLSGEKSLPEDLKAVLTRPSLDTQAVQRLTLSALLVRLMAGTDDDGVKSKLGQMLDRAKALGIDGIEAR
jgi:hypothetical protein